MWYSVRNFLQQDAREKFLTRLEERVALVAATYPGTTVTVEKILGHPALHNSSAAVSRVAELLVKMGVPVDHIQSNCEAVLGGEDFAHYLHEKPGCFWFIGASQPGTGAHHTPTFAPSEDVLPKVSYIHLLGGDLNWLRRFSFGKCSVLRRTFRICEHDYGMSAPQGFELNVFQWNL